MPFSRTLTARLRDRSLGKKRRSCDEGRDQIPSVSGVRRKFVSWRLRVARCSVKISRQGRTS
jgi:hypothetical protein